MDIQTVFISSYEVLISLIFGLLTVFISIKVLNITFLKSKEGNLLIKGNTAISLFAAVIIFCVLYLVHSSVLPSVNALRSMILGTHEITAKIIFISFGYFLAFFLVSLIISLVIIFLSTQIYLTATIHIDEMSEIKKDNVAVAILISAVLLGMTVFIKPAVQRFISSLVNYETLETIEVERPPLEIENKELLIYPKQKSSPE